MGSGYPARWAIGIASSTGGPQACEQVLGRFPADLSAVVMISQHMPAEFTGPFAQRLDRTTALSVREASGGEGLSPGCVFVAPGGYHLVVGDGHRTALDDGPKVCFVRPAADVMLQSMAQKYGSMCVAVILTGMGHDGTAGARAVRQAGGLVVVQDPEDAQISSMPRSVISDGSCNLVLPVVLIGLRVVRLLRDGGV